MFENLCANMQVVVLLGGLGKRLGEFTKEIPKPLIDVHGKKFFEYQLNLMRRAGFRKFVFCVGYRSEQIENYFGDGKNFGVEIKYSYDGEKLLGTAGAVKNALSLLEDDFMLIYGDSFMDINYFEVVIRYRNGLENGKKSLMTVIKNKNQWDLSNVLYQDGEIKLYDKKSRNSAMSYIDYGVNVFRREIFEKLPDEGIFDLSDIQHELSLKNLLAACEVYKRFYEIGNPSSLDEFRKYSLKRFFNKNKAVFLDRDGVINEIIWNEDAEQLDSPLKINQFKLLPNVIEAMKILQKKGYLIFVVTNQPAAAKGKTTYSTLCDINGEFLKLMQNEGIEIADIEICPHHEKGSTFAKEKFLIRDCDCRKPKTGMLQDICEKYCIDVSVSWFVGDSATDVLCGKNFGLNTAFTGNFKCDSCSMLNYNQPDGIYKDLLNFAEEL